MASVETQFPPVFAVVPDTKEASGGALGGHSTRGPWQKFVSYIWDSDYYEKSDKERHLVFKLDCFMLSVLTLGWWIKNVDQSNLGNAYVSGMQEDLAITANQYTYMLTIYSAVVCALQIPSNFIVMKVRPSIFLAGCEIGWGIFTFAQAGAQSYQAMYGFRFAIAFFESFYYPVGFFILGSWYTKRELAKRIGLWFVAGPAGSAFSGYMQAGIYSSLNGAHGIAGWRWLYIVCGIITIPCGILLFFLVPDFPETTKIWYLNDEEKAMAKARCARAGMDAMTGKIDRKVIVNSLKTPMYWTLVIFYAVYGFAVQNGVQFGVYLKAFGYSVTLRNVLPSCMYVIQIPCILFYCFISDRLAHRSRGIVMVLPLIWGIFPTGVLAFWGNSDPLRVFAFMVNGSIYMTPVFYAWVADICAGNAGLRGFITGSTSCLFYCINAWLPTIVFLQTDGPRFQKGFTTTFACCVASVFGSGLIWYLQQRQKKQLARDAVPNEAISERPSQEDVESKA